MITVNIGSQGHSQINEITYVNLLYNHLTNVNQTEQILSSFSPEHQDNAKWNVCYNVRLKNTHFEIIFSNCVELVPILTQFENFCKVRNFFQSALPIRCREYIRRLIKEKHSQSDCKICSRSLWNLISIQLISLETFFWSVKVHRFSKDNSIDDDKASTLVLYFNA